MDAFARDSFDHDRPCSIDSKYGGWDTSRVPATRKLNVVHACKALVAMNRVLRSKELEPSMRRKMAHARHEVRRMLALRPH